MSLIPHSYGTFSTTVSENQEAIKKAISNKKSAISTKSGQGKIMKRDPRYVSRGRYLE